jgi:hypothetical protein
VELDTIRLLTSRISNGFRIVLVYYFCTFVPSGVVGVNLRVDVLNNSVNQFLRLGFRD